MKKLLCFLLCLTLILSSISLCFATPTTWDTSDQANLRYIYQTLSSGSLYTLVNNIYSRMNTINNSIQDLEDFLVYNGDTITEWIYNINTWMSPIYNSITNIPVDLSTIIGALGYFDANNTYHPYLNETLTYRGMRPSWISSPNRLLYQYNGGLGTISSNSFDFSAQSLLGTLSLQQFIANENTAKFYGDLMGNWNSPYTRTRWTDLGNESITPTSGIRGLVAMLEWIQQPVARLSYVLASDERIEAQEAAAANEEAVVDNFIDSSGDGAASTSDFGSVSDLSSGYKQNFGSDASPSGIFDIFNSDHATWFSQETKNQLDTTTPSRMIKGSASETPLLDKQIEDIYDALGVKQP